MGKMGQKAAFAKAATKKKGTKKPTKKSTKKEQSMLRSAYRAGHAQKASQQIRKHHRPGEIYARAGVKSRATSTNTDPLPQKG